MATREWVNRGRRAGTVCKYSDRTGGRGGGGDPRENREVIRAPKVRQKYPRQILYRDAVPNRDAVILIATRHATPLQTPRCRHGHAGHHHGEGRHPIGCAARDGMGGGIFAKTAKIPPPLQSGVCGDFIAIRIASKGRPLPPPPCAYHATPHAPMNPWF